MHYEDQFCAAVTYKGDYVVGIADRLFTVEIPDFRQQFADHEQTECSVERANIRNQIKTLFQGLDDEQTPVVTFSDEQTDDESFDDCFERAIDGFPFFGDDQS